MKRERTPQTYRTYWSPSVRAWKVLRNRRPLLTIGRLLGLQRNVTVDLRSFSKNQWKGILRAMPQRQKLGISLE